MAAISPVRFKQQIASGFPNDYVGMAKGDYPGVNVIHRIAFNPTVQQTQETVWPEGGNYVFPTVATTMTISSDNAADDVGSTGAFEVLVIGLDTDFVITRETIAMDGQTAVTVPTDLMRVLEVVVTDADDTTSIGGNVGTIYLGEGTVTAGVPATIYASISPNTARSQLGVTTVPAGRDAFLVQTVFSSDTQNTEFQLCGRLEGGVFQLLRRFFIENGSVGIPDTYPFRFPEKTDLEFRAIESTGAAQVSIEYDLLTVDHDISGLGVGPPPFPLS